MMDSMTNATRQDSQNTFQSISLLRTRIQATGMPEALNQPLKQTLNLTERSSILVPILAAAVTLGPQWLGANKTLTLRAFEGARYIFGYRFQREAVSTAPI